MWILNCCEGKISKDNEKRLANQILCFLSPNRDKMSVYHKSIYRDQQMVRPKPKEVTTSNQVSTQKGPKSSLFYRGVRVWNSQTHCWIPRSRAKIESHYLEVNDPKLRSSPAWVMAPKCQRQNALNNEGDDFIQIIEVVRISQIQKWECLRTSGFALGFYREGQTNYRWSDLYINNWGCFASRGNLSKLSEQQMFLSVVS